MGLFDRKKKSRFKEDEGVQDVLSQLDSEEIAALEDVLDGPGPEPEEGQAEPAVQDLELEYASDGVYLSLWSAEPIPVKEQENIVRHLSRKKISDLDMAQVLTALTEPVGERLLIAPPQEENHYDEAYTVSFSKDLMEAYITLIPPESEHGKRLDVVEVFQELESVHQILFGLDLEVLGYILETPVYDLPQMIAMGQAPITGEDGSLEWHFDQRDGVNGYRVKQVDENEKVDYKKLDLFVPVKKDDLLVTRIPPQEGEPGYTVTGRKIPGENGKNYNLPRGKNTYITQDGLELRSSMDGRVEVINGSVEVNNFYHVPGDVDMSVGNIDFDGDVIVEGSVLSDFTIRASGNIMVKGNVEAAMLEAGGDIVVQGGVQGAGKGVLVAGDGIFVRFAEYATVQASSVIVAESLLHSNVNCFGAVEALSGRGSIIGGNICAGSYIAAKYLGTSNGRATGLQVGISPSHRMRIDEMESSLAMLKMEIVRLQGLLDELPEAGRQNERQKKVRMENVKRLLQCKKLLTDQEEELQELKGHLSESESGQVHAMNIAYPGVFIAIGFARYSVSQQVMYATFRKGDDEEIEFTSCRFKQQPMRAKKRRR